MMVDINEIIAKLQEIENESYGCGNGRVIINKWIKQLKRDYGITDNSN